MTIKSILDTDLYKITMQQAVFHNFPNNKAEYRFKCRTKNINLAKNINKIIDAVRNLENVKLTPNEAIFLSTKPYMASDYIQFLKNFMFNSKNVSISQSAVDGEIDIVISGLWVETILYEVPILSIINEINFSEVDQNLAYDEGDKQLQEKIKFVQDNTDDGFKFMDFGTRRRFSLDWQGYVIEQLKSKLPQNIIGTSNVFYAMQKNMTPIGTMAHEWLQAAQALAPDFKTFQQFALQTWINEYKGKLSIALSDVVGTDAFLDNFDYDLSTQYEGLRQDSGAPIEWGYKVLKHYEKQNIDPTNKTMVFSDSLNFKKAINIYNEFKGKFNMVFGIGTNLTNDLGFNPINIVIKMSKLDNKPVIKISDDSGKTMDTDAEYLAFVKKTFNIQ